MAKTGENPQRVFSGEKTGGVTGILTRKTLANFCKIFYNRLSEK